MVVVNDLGTAVGQGLRSAADQTVDMIKAGAKPPLTTTALRQRKAAEYYPNRR